jgi:hypothetical protein
MLEGSREEPFPDPAEVLDALEHVTLRPGKPMMNLLAFPGRPLDPVHLPRRQGRPKVFFGRERSRSS